MKLLTTSQLISRYGQPGDVKNLTSITLPYKMRLAWDVSQTVTKITCNKGIAEQLTAIFTALKCTYGEARLKELGIDLFGGCFNHRPKRGLESKYATAIARKNYTLAASYLSTHSWAVAIDLDPARNTLRETKRTARFARPEYKAMIDIFYAHGFLSYGVEKDFDWMHMEAAG